MTGLAQLRHELDGARLSTEMGLLKKSNVLVIYNEVIWSSGCDTPGVGWLVEVQLLVVRAYCKVQHSLAVAWGTLVV